MIVGCPVRDRGWVINHWHEYLNRAIVDDVPFVLAGAEDDPTRDVIDFNHIWLSTGEQFSPYQRDWANNRWQQISDVRNLLLDYVSQFEQDFLSVDSDILVHPEQVDVMRECRDRFDVVGGKVYLSPKGKFHASYANLGRNMQLKRSDSTGTFRVDVVMALKLMSPEVVQQVRYRPAPHGEDIGFSQDTAKAGFKLGWTGAVCSKHLFTRECLQRVDQRCGF